MVRSVDELEVGENMGMWIGWCIESGWAGAHVGMLVGGYDMIAYGLYRAYATVHILGYTIAFVFT